MSLRLLERHAALVCHHLQKHRVLVPIERVTVLMEVTGRTDIFRQNHQAVGKPPISHLSDPPEESHPQGDATQSVADLSGMIQVGAKNYRTVRLARDSPLCNL